MRILFVENHSVFARMAIDQFLAGEAVALVPSLATARSALKEGCFDAVLVDFDLDDGKGTELVAELREAGFAGRIVAVSSHAAGNDALRAAGADSICRKADFAQLSAVLHAAR